MASIFDILTTLPPVALMLLGASWLLMLVLLILARNRGHTIETYRARLKTQATSMEEQQLLLEGFSTAHAALQEDFQHAQDMLNAIPWAVWRRTRDLTIVACNQAYANAVGESISSVIEHDTELHKESRLIAEVAASNRSLRTEQQYVIVNGARYLYEITEIPDQHGDGTIGFARDLSRFEAIRDELRATQATQQDLLENTRSAIVIFGANKSLQFYNRAYANLWGLESPWLDGKPTCGEILEALREKRKLPEQADFKSFKRDQMNLFTTLLEKREEVYYLPSGRVLRVMIIPHSNGGLLFSYEDMTEQIALERSYNTLVSVQKYTLDNLNEGIAVFREDGRLEFYNPVYAKLWHLEPAMLSTQPHLNDILERTRGYYEPIGDWDMFKKSFLALLHRRTPSRERLERSDGIVLEFNTIPLPDGATLLTYNDSTDSYRVESSLRAEKQALQDADAVKNRFLSNVSYELRSPLTSIRGYAELMHHQYAGPMNPKQLEYMQDILQASQRLQQVIDNVLDMAAMEAGYISLYKARFPLHALLQSVIDETREKIGERAVQFRLIVPEDIGTMFADENAVYRVLTSLLDNATRAVNDKGNISLRVERTGMGTLVFTISDDGRGIPELELPYVFDKFFKASNDNYSGTGLGLAVCKALVERHEGNIHVTSVPGKETIFTCSFPQ